MEKLLNVLQKLSALMQKRYMKVIMNGFMSVAAVSIAGSIFTLIKSIPIGPWQTFLTTSGFGDLLSIPVSITSDLMALYVVIGMAYALAKSFQKDGFAAAVISLGAFMILTPLTTNVTSVNEAGETVVTTVASVIPVASVGSQGIFLAIITGLVATRLYVFFLDKGWKIKMPASVPPNVTSMFENMIPGGIVFVVFLAVRYGLSLTPFGTAQRLIYGILQQPLMAVGGGLVGALIYVIAIKIFWWAGIHGGMVVMSAMMPIISTVGAANAAAFAAGQPAPSPEWIYATLICPGIGVFALTLLMAILGKSKQYKTLSRIALPTSFFGITEPMMFGTPIVMNPIVAVPFVLSPVITLLLSLLVTKIGLVAPPTGAGLNAFMPLPILGPMMNAHWTGLVWVLVLIVINMALYYPFFLALDRKAVQEEQANEAAE